MLEETVLKQDEAFLREILEVLDTNKQTDVEEKAESSKLQEGNLREYEIKDPADDSNVVLDADTAKTEYIDSKASEENKNVSRIVDALDRLEQVHREQNYVLT